jgi:hypothetical protein
LLVSIDLFYFNRANKLKNMFLKNIFESHFSKSKYPSFWTLNTIGWVLLILADTFIVSPELLDSWNSVLINAIQWSIGYFLTGVLRVIYKSFHSRRKSLYVIIGYILIFSLLSSLLFFTIAHAIFGILSPSDFKQLWEAIADNPFRYMAFRLTSVFPLMTTWSFLYFGIKFWLDWSTERDRAEKADLLAQSAQLQMLRYQVNPHFLFNSFSSLRALIRKDQLKAEEMLSKLSEFYRYSLATKNSSEVALIEEIEAIEHYFEIEKIRFGKNIEFKINIEPIAEEYPIPSFLLHPIVENAIKYGMKTSELPLKIKIHADVIENELLISVENTGKWYKHTKNRNVQSTNTGIKNIKSRLSYSYPNNHEIITKEENGWVKVIIKFFKELHEN